MFRNTYVTFADYNFFLILRRSVVSWLTDRRFESRAYLSNFFAGYSVSGKFQECVELILSGYTQGFGNGFDIVAAPTDR